jgi:hypothetical protein
MISIGSVVPAYLGHMSHGDVGIAVGSGKISQLPYEREGLISASQEIIEGYEGLTSASQKIIKLHQQQIKAIPHEKIVHQQAIKKQENDIKRYQKLIEHHQKIIINLRFSDKI